MMKTTAMVLGAALLLLTCEAQAATSMAKKFDAGPAIQGNSDPAVPMHKRKTVKHGMPKKTM